MARKTSRRTGAHDIPTSRAAKPASPTPGSVLLTPEQVARWADLLARGEAGLPEGLAPCQEEELRQHVCRLRRARLIRFIARQIAQDISGKAELRQRGDDHATAYL